MKFFEGDLGLIISIVRFALLFILRALPIFFKINNRVAIGAEQMTLVLPTPSTPPANDIYAHTYLIHQS